jgi:PAS domain S-box-containing protein
MTIVKTMKNSEVSEFQHISLLNSIPALVSCVSKELYYTYVNQAFADFVKMEKASIIGQPIQTILGEETYKHIEKYILKALHGEKVTYQTTFEMMDGHHFFEATYIPQIDSNNQVTGYTSFVVKMPAKAEELLQKNEELKKSEERYHQMVEEVEDYAIILLDVNGDILDWNKGAEKIKGYKPSEIIGQNFRIFYLPEDRNRNLPEKLINTAIQKGKAEHEGWRVKKDGTKFWGLIIITALHDKEGKIIGFTKVTRDLSERKLAEEEQERTYKELQEKTEALKRSEELHHKMIAEVQDYAIILLDKSGNILNWNKGAENIKGYKAEEILGRNFRLFYTNEDREKKLPETLLKEACDNGKATHEGWRVRKDGTRFWGSIVITALHNDEGNIIGYSKVTRDLTARKAAEEKQQRFAAELQFKNEELRRSEERYHKMIAEVEDYAIILLDAEGRIQNWNKGAENIKGYKAEEVIGKKFSIFYLPEDRATLPGKLLNLAQTSGSAHHEGWRVKKDGTRFWGSIVITALHDTEGNIIGYSKVTRDLTERKIAEDKQKQNAEQLEAQNKELEQFAYVASHDLQEPLRKIRTFNAMIIEHEGERLSEKGRDYFERSISAADRMNRLIEDLLTYSRATRDANNVEPVDLNAVAARVKSNYKDAEKKITIDIDPLPTLVGMRFQFEQLFDNLVNNGIKYQPEGNQPYIQIRYRTVAGDEISGKGLSPQSRFHEISFTDNGIGFNQEYADKIFEMFQRLHGRSEYSGSGIGLAIVKKIVQNYNGFITAESQPGHGATFHVYFPM